MYVKQYGARTHLTPFKCVRRRHVCSFIQTPLNQRIIVNFHECTELQTEGAVQQKQESEKVTDPRWKAAAIIKSRLPHTSEVLLHYIDLITSVTNWFGLMPHNSINKHGEHRTQDSYRLKRSGDDVLCVTDVLHVAGPRWDRIRSDWVSFWILCFHRWSMSIILDPSSADLSYLYHT